MGKEKIKNILRWLSRKKKWLIIGLIIVIAVGGVLFWQHRKNVALEALKQQMVLPTAVVERGDVQRIIYASGNIHEDNGEEVRPGVTARVNSVYVKEGQAVKAGDLLFTLDDSEIALEYAKDRLAYNTESRKLTQEINGLQSSETRADSAGTISKVLVEVGDEIKSDTVIAKMTKDDAFELKAGFNSRDINEIKEGQTAEIFIQEFLTTVPGKVIRVDHRGQSTSIGGLLYRVTIEVPNPGALQVGNSGNAKINTGSRIINSAGFEKLTPLDEEDIRAGCQGKINRLTIKDGDSIDQGQLLLSVDKSEQKATLREKQLALEQSQITLELKQKAYDKYQARASINGTVVELNVEEGKDLPSDKAAVVITGTGALKMIVKVDEIDIPYVKVGQKADVYANAYGDRKFPAVVTRVAEKGKIDGSTVYFETELAIQEPGPLKAGMTGDADILAEQRQNVLRLPIDAVSIEDTGSGTVMIKKKGKNEPEMRPVKTGIETDEYIEIITGVKEGEEVIINQGMPEAMPPI